MLTFANAGINNWSILEAFRMYSDFLLDFFGVLNSAIELACTTADNA
jgi:hypothetical protein